jgi:hypothetical protein
MFHVMKQPSPATIPVRDIYTVSRLNREAKGLLESSFPPIWIEGEISNLSRPASGHVYFSLKDPQAQVRCAFFRQHQRLVGITLKDGLHVLLRARVSLYEGRGDFQIIVEYLEEAGEGALRALSMRSNRDSQGRSLRNRAQATAAPAPIAYRHHHFPFRRGAARYPDNAQTPLPAIAVLVFRCRCRARARPRKSPRRSG